MKAFYLIVLSILSLPLFSQEVSLTGRVTDEKGVPVPQAMIQVTGTNQLYFTTGSGTFDIKVESAQTYTLRISAPEFANHYLSDIAVGNEDLDLGDVQLKSKQLNEVLIEYKGKNIVPFPKVDLALVPSQSGNFEDLVKLVGLGVSSNNEMTSNYNVRGGNYDENLIYVNGIQIYRPFLVRSGQQEGLSFINPAFVENIYFSAGGFDAYYGDKLSSVLDIQYREPSRFGGSVQASLMGGAFHLEGRLGKRGNYITGARYRANSYILNSLPTQGDYNPVFFDYQLLANHYLDYSKSSYKKLFVLGHYSSNNYRFVPTTRNTSWGTVNEAYQLRVFYEGQEETKFSTVTAATGLDWKVNKNLNMQFVTSMFRSVESENFDILGEYWINQLETDPSKEEFGDSTSNVGVGGLLDHARNSLNVWIANAYWNGHYTSKSQFRQNNPDGNYRFGEMHWGLKGQYEFFDDNISEWHVIDSAGYSIPNGDPNTIELQEVIKQKNVVETYRFTSHFQYSQSWVTKKDVVSHTRIRRKNKETKEKTYIEFTDSISNSPANFTLIIGERLGYRAYNDEIWFTPRMSMTFTPRSYYRTIDSSLYRRNIKLRFSSGLYYQPPFYRTMRGLYGEINPDVVSQKSWHNVLGASVDFNMWGRPFKFQSELYYKYMWDVVPYEIDNVRIRYYAENSAVAYAYGFDAKINGEFVPGVESFFRIGLLKTMEDINNDEYYLYLNSEGDTIIQGYTFNDVPTDSILQVPGWIPRPTDQTLTFAVYFQDKMPGFENFKVSANLMMGTPLPYGPPTFERYKDVLRTKAYWRFDVGFMYDFINDKNRESLKTKKFIGGFEQFTISLDAFNLLGINNIISYQWLQDIYGRYYAIPNHLTGRRINLRIILKF